MPCRIDLRHDQHVGLLPESERDGITIYAPEWVQDGLRILGERLHGTTFNVYDSDLYGRGDMFEIFTTTVPLTLVQLQKIARNEKQNTSGIILKPNYQPDIDDAVIYGIKDLVRQCIIVGLDETTHFGGYGSERVTQKVPAYIVDLIGLQFQRSYNSGRLVLCKKYGTEGCLDQLIYYNVVGELKPPFDMVEAQLHRGNADFSRRYVPVGNDTYFDTFAYKKFVAADVMLCVLGLNLTARNTMDENVNDTKSHIHFKFRRYTKRYFVGPCKALIKQHMLTGVIDGLERALQIIADEATTPIPERFTSFEFPFFKNSPEAKTRLDALSNKYSFVYKFTGEDPLKMTAPPGAVHHGIHYTIATTNCADPHAATGNKMGFNSVDGAIAENLKSKGNIFNPLLNSKITGQFIRF